MKDLSRFPGGPLSFDQRGCRLTNVHPGTPGNSVKHPSGIRAGNFTFKDSLDVLSQRLAAGSGTPG
jgi:hypothetical protein